MALDFKHITSAQSLTATAANTLNAITISPSQDSSAGKKVLKKVGAEVGYLLLTICSIAEVIIRSIAFLFCKAGEKLSNRFHAHSLKIDLNINMVVFAKLLSACFTNLGGNVDLQTNAAFVQNYFFPSQT